MNDKVTHTVRTVESLGKRQYEEYHKTVLVDGARSIHDPIKKNSLPLFKCPTAKEKSKQADKIATLKADVSLFAQLYIVAQDRESDLKTFFQHENNPYPHTFLTEEICVLEKSLTCSSVCCKQKL